MIFFDTSDLKDEEMYLSLVGTGEAIPERKWVPSYTFDICLSDGTRIGYCNFRVDNSECTKYCGNIGYGIDERYRGNHYSLKASKLLFELARKHGLEYVLITCSPNNMASNKICQLLHAQFIETADIPIDHEMYPEHKNINIYKMQIA